MFLHWLYKNFQSSKKVENLQKKLEELKEKGFKELKKKTVEIAQTVEEKAVPERLQEFIKLENNRYVLKDNFKKIAIYENIDSSDLKALSLALTNNKSLENFVLCDPGYNCDRNRDCEAYDLDESSLTALAQAINRHPKLKKISLIRCRINDAGLQAFSEELEGNQSFEEIYFYENNFNENFLTALGKLIKKCPNLKKIGLEHCSINGASLQSLIEELEDNQPLEEINLSNNKFYKDDLTGTSLGKLFNKCPKLKKIDLKK